MKITSILKMFALALVIAGTLAACGQDDNTTSNNNTSTTTITGQAIAGAVTGQVHVHDGNDTHLVTGTVTNGVFSVDLPNTALSQSLDFEVNGTYRDEVSGATVTLTAANPLALRTAANAFTAGVAGNAPITPGSSIIRALVVSHGKTLSEAETAFNTAFGYTPDLTVRPFDPYTTTITNQTTADQEAAFRVGHMSQLGADLGLNATDLAAMPASFAADLADGKLDGLDALNAHINFTSSSVDLYAMHTTTPIANRLVIAVSNFTGSAANVAGVTPPTMGLPPLVGDAAGTTKQLTLADGTLINVKMESVNSAPFQTGFRNVRTSHKFTLTNAATGLPYTASNIMIMPMMYMNSGHNHGSPHAMVDNTNAATGIYTSDIYYLMASGMNGMPMGQWQLDVQLGDNTVGANMMDPYAHTFFYPNVMMNMGTDVLMDRLNSANDTWTNMMGMTTPREYRVWLKDITVNGAGGHDVTVFVSTQNMANMAMGGMAMAHSPMSFPAVYAGQTLEGLLSGMSRPTYSLASVAVTINGSAATPVMMGMMNTGEYKVVGLAGLTSAAPATLDITLTVDGNVMKTTAGNNATLSFTAP